jgi:hypothetical protein
MIVRKKIPLILALAMVSACTDPNTTGEARAVVEAYLAPGKPIEVLISKESLFKGSTIDTVEFIDGLTLSIHEGDHDYALQSIGDGKYVSDESVVVDAQKTYSLDFEYGGKALALSTYVPSRPVGFKLSASEIEVDRPDPGSGTPPTRPEPVEASWENPDNDYHLVVVTVIEEDPEEISTGAVIAGSFRNKPNTGTTYNIGPFNFKYYGMHAVILYKLNPEYATLYDDSGNSSLNLKAPYSNITNGLGIFTGMHSDTLYLNVTKP